MMLREYDIQVNRDLKLGPALTASQSQAPDSSGIDGKVALQARGFLGFKLGPFFLDVNKRDFLAMRNKMVDSRMVATGLGPSNA
ncbi:MAG: hypothetical protein ACREAC_21380 [Blastocatellia bacterium]